ncbi:MAG: LytR/AlgR family response regulator transcription factor [Blastocatellia bacterium]
MTMKRFQALIVDDERPARQRLRQLLKKQPAIEVAGECSNGLMAVKALKESSPDLLLLDVQMPGLNGFGVLREAGLDCVPVTIFVTAYDKYAVQAFEACALDYLLKPYSDERFEQSLARALAQLRARERDDLSRRLLSLLEQTGSVSTPLPATPQPDRTSGYLERLLIKAGAKIIFLPTAEISWIEADGVYVKLHAATKTYLYRSSLTDLETRLNPGNFVCIHRSAIVNIQSIKELYPHSHGDYVAVLNDGAELKLSRNYRSKIEACLRHPL